MFYSDKAEFPILHSKDVCLWGVLSGKKSTQSTRFPPDFMDSTCKKRIYSKYEHIHPETIKLSAVLSLEKNRAVLNWPAHGIIPTHSELNTSLKRSLKLSGNISMALSKITTTPRCSTAVVGTGGSFQAALTVFSTTPPGQKATVRIFSHTEP